MLNNETITFGKYSGKELSELLKDRNYCKWVIKQDWFQTSYEFLYNRVREYNPLSYFLKPVDEEKTEFVDTYPFFSLNSVEDLNSGLKLELNLDLNLTENEKKCYEYYLKTVQDLRERIISRKDEENKYAIKAPVKWLQKFEKDSGLKREEFKLFLSSYDLPNITSIVEDIKKEGGIEYKGAKSFLIAKENSEKQEKWWEGILKGEFGEELGTQFKYQNCIFDFINISTNTLYECKLGLKDFNEEQYKKYTTALEKFRIIYLIGNDCIIDCVDKTIQTTDKNKYLTYLISVKSPNKFETAISGFEITEVDTLKIT